RWYNPVPTVVISGYDSVVAADSNLPSYTDPTTGAVQTDIASGNVYVAWGTFSGAPTGVNNPAPFNSYKVRVTSTSDGGNTFMPAVYLNTTGAGGVFENYSNTWQAAPQLITSQGTADGRIKGGDVNVVFDNFHFPPPGTVIGDQIMADRAPAGTGGEFTAGPTPINNALVDPVTNANIPQVT